MSRLIAGKLLGGLELSIYLQEVSRPPRPQIRNVLWLKSAIGFEYAENAKLNEATNKLITGFFGLAGWL